MLKNLFALRKVGFQAAIWTRSGCAAVCSRAVPELIDAVMSHIEGHNDDPSPFVWSKTAEEIIEKDGRWIMPQPRESDH